LLERRLAMVEAILDRHEQGVLYERPRLRLSSLERRRIDTMMGELKAVIGSIAATHQLECETRDPAREIASLLSVSWENLGNVGTSGLTAYGPVDPVLRETLDPVLEAMMVLLIDLGAAAEDGGGTNSGTR
jgi:hypothetical protein